MDYTVFFTVFLGFVTFVLGQVVVKLVIDPVQEMNKTVGKIAHSLTYFADVTGNPGVQAAEVNLNASKELRRLSADLESHLYSVPAYSRTAVVFHLPGQKAVLDVCRNLIGLSNSVMPIDVRGNLAETNSKRVQDIRLKLGLYVAPDEIIVD
jgi:hypothetical protein